MESVAKAPSRLNIAAPYPKAVYLESLMVFFGANFLFHQNVFRRVGSRPQFAAFMVVNAFTSLQVAEISNMTYLRRCATIYNNTKEMEHRAEVNAVVRTRMLNQRLF